MLAALHLVGVGEAFMLGKKWGMELPALWDALKASAGNSYVLETEGPFSARPPPPPRRSSAAPRQPLRALAISLPLA